MQVIIADLLYAQC